MMLVFWILATLVLISALAVVLLPSALHGALCLAVNLVSVAAIYALLGAHFLAAVQIIVYAGAIMVLVVFVLMLLNLKAEQHSFLDIVMLIVGLCASGFCASLILPKMQEEFVGKLLLTHSTGETPAVGSVAELGKHLFTQHSFLFQLTGVILITAIVGAVMLASQRRVPKVVGEG